VLVSRSDMKKLIKWLGIVVAVLVALVGIALAWVLATWDKDYAAMPKPAITASADPAVIAHGEYLFNAVAHCSSCHGGPTSTTRKRGDRVPAVGGYVFEAGPFGRFVARNLTADRETGLGAQSDGEIARAIRSGVDREGKFIPFMKVSVGSFADEDLTALVSYIRTLPPVRRQEEPEVWGLLGKYLAATSFRPAVKQPPPYIPLAAEPSAARGGYLANGPAGCRFCHTPHDPMAGFAEAGIPFSGGDPDSDETDPTSEFAPPNLTPDATSSPIAAWDEATFVTRFRGGAVFRGSHMPWENFAELTDADVRSIFRYLRTLAPVRRPIGPSHRPVGWKPEAR
jgi:mono/diheme cytochrome c family protein